MTSRIVFLVRKNLASCQSNFLRTETVEITWKIGRTEYFFAEILDLTINKIKNLAIVLSFRMAA